jgi:predicted acylesterase/phospholipase RssA
VKAAFRWRAALTGALTLLAACSTVPERAPAPSARYAEAVVPGLPANARAWADGEGFQSNQIASLSDAELRAVFPAVYGRPHAYLAISGGGADGAYGAGLLKGWTAAGDRPEFAIVTGISTGALIAPFAFLGPQYDAVLEEIYTSYTTDQVVELRPIATIPFGDSVLEIEKFDALIAKYVTDDVIDEIAAAHRSGRRLFIGTTNLDVGRPVSWNIGGIAASDAPGRQALIRKLMRASASIPGVFPPVYIDVEIDGARYDEIHVDGGATSQVFLYPAKVDFRVIVERLRVQGKPRAFIIRNSPLNPPVAPLASAGIVPIAGKSISSLIRTQGLGDLHALYTGALRDGMEYNLAFVPESFDRQPAEFFDRAYMQALFELGYSRARAGYPWSRTPPGL